MGMELRPFYKPLAVALFVLVFIVQATDWGLARAFAGDLQRCGDYAFTVGREGDCFFRNYVGMLKANAMMWAVRNGVDPPP